MKVRESQDKDEFRALTAAINALHARSSFSARTSGVLANATTAGKIKTTVACVFALAGALYSKAITDNLWDLTGQTATASGKYRAYHLYLDASGAASISAAPTADASTAAGALALLPAIPDTKSVVGVFVAGPSTDFTAAPSSQGTLYNGLPDAAYYATVNGVAQVALPVVLGGF
jgi:hypothetical protein